MKKWPGILLFMCFCLQSRLFAGGISVDAGITPPQDRYILRAQYRFMSMENSMMTMNTHMTPLVLAYGVTSGITVMARTMYVHQTIENSSSLVNSGINDLFILSKFRLYRKNTASYVFGIAPHVATNLPTGSGEVSNGSWNPELGMNISFRPRFFSVDVTAAYVFSDITNKLDQAPGNSFSLNTALSALIPLGSSSRKAFSPVVEMTYIHTSKNGTEPAADLMFLSPGFSFIHSNLALEALVQLPAFQTEGPGIMQQKPRLIAGIKYMF